METLHIKMCLDVHTKVGTVGMTCCYDVHTWVGTKHIRMCLNIHTRVGNCVQMLMIGWGDKIQGRAECGKGTQLLSTDDVNIYLYMVYYLGWCSNR